jgi:chromosome segregation ATPase
LGSRNDSLRKQVDTLTTQITDLGEELEDSLRANAKAQGRIRSLENELHESVAEIRQLRRGRGSAAVIESAQQHQPPKAA